NDPQGINLMLHVIAPFFSSRPSRHHRMTGFSEDPAHGGFIESGRIPNRRNGAFGTGDIEDAGLLLQLEREIVKLLDRAERCGELELTGSRICSYSGCGPIGFLGNPRRCISHSLAAQLGSGFFYSVEDLRVFAAAADVS